MISFLLVFAFLFILVSISIGLGIALGNNVRQKNKTTKKSLSSVVGATLAFLGFILALILSMVSSRFAIRKQLVLDEANAIGTAIIRTEFLNELADVLDDQQSIPASFIVIEPGGVLTQDLFR